MGWASICRCNAALQWRRRPHSRDGLLIGVVMMSGHGVSPVVAMPDQVDLQNTLQALTERVSQLGAQVENLIESFETRFLHLSARLHNVEKLQTGFQTGGDKAPFPDAKRIKVDDFKLSISEHEINLMHSQLAGPVKDAIHELGRVALFNQDVALRFLRIGSDKSVAIATLHSKEFQAKRDSINWSFLTVDAVEVLEKRFVKTVAKKVEHTKRKIRQHSSEDLLATAQYGKTGQPFVGLLLEWLLKRREVGNHDATCTSLSTSNASPNTTASASDMLFEAKTVFTEVPHTERSNGCSTDISILPGCNDNANGKDADQLPAIATFSD